MRAVRLAWAGHADGRDNDCDTGIVGGGVVDEFDADCGGIDIPSISGDDHAGETICSNDAHCGESSSIGGFGFECVDNFCSCPAYDLDGVLDAGNYVSCIPSHESFIGAPITEDIELLPGQTISVTISDYGVDGDNFCSDEVQFRVDGDNIGFEDGVAIFEAVGADATIDFVTARNAACLVEIEIS